MSASAPLREGDRRPTSASGAYLALRAPCAVQIQRASPGTRAPNRTSVSSGMGVQGQALAKLQRCRFGHGPWRGHRPRQPLEPSRPSERLARERPWVQIPRDSGGRELAVGAPLTSMER